MEKRAALLVGPLGLAAALAAASCGLSVAGDSSGMGADGGQGGRPRVDAASQDVPNGGQGEESGGQVEAGGGVEASAMRDGTTPSGDSGRPDAPAPTESGGPGRDAGREVGPVGPPDAPTRDARSGDTGGGDACGDGCAPIAVAFTGDTATMTCAGNAAPTYTYGDPCPTGDAIMGLAGHVYTAMGYWYDIAAVCGVVQIDPASGTVTVTEDTDTKDEGDTAANGTATEADCPMNAVVVGLSANGPGGGTHVHNITLVCATLTAVMSAQGYALSWTSTTSVSVGGDSVDNCGPNDCMSMSAVATQIDDTFDDDGLGSIGFGCATMTAGQ